jgi:energy-coupling factor transporter ATP-binding protein EcfA2
MWEDSVKTVAAQIRTLETILILGASDNGKTTFASELAKLLVLS